MSDTQIHIIGAGLAGSEAAWQLAERGIRVLIHEMKPQKFSPAHKSADYAELVCSNSFRSDNHQNSAIGLLHQEMRLAGSLIMRCADAAKVPAGGALAVDRDEFARRVKAGETLTTEEQAERAALRREYIDSVKANLAAQLDSTYLVEPDGTKHKLPKKPS